MCLRACVSPVSGVSDPSQAPRVRHAAVWTPVPRRTGWPSEIRGSWLPPAFCIEVDQVMLIGDAIKLGEALAVAVTPVTGIGQEADQAAGCLAFLVVPLQRCLETLDAVGVGEFIG